jgi:hypothetical protein
MKRRRTPGSAIAFRRRRSRKLACQRSTDKTCRRTPAMPRAPPSWAHSSPGTPATRAAPDEPAARGGLGRRRQGEANRVRHRLSGDRKIDLHPRVVRTLSRKDERRSRADLRGRALNAGGRHPLVRPAAATPKHHFRDKPELVRGRSAGGRGARSGDARKSFRPRTSPRRRRVSVVVRNDELLLDAVTARQ